MFEEFIMQITDVALASVVGLGAFATALTALLKRVSLFDDLPAKTLNVIVVIGVFIIAMVADEFGYIEQFDNVFDIAVRIVVALAGGLVGSAGIYHVAKKTDTPLLGASRSDK